MACWEKEGAPGCVFGVGNRVEAFLAVYLDSKRGVQALGIGWGVVTGLWAFCVLGHGELIGTCL